jgi:Tfp pilus assembly pilus retraction ATPase PilT
MSGLEILGRGKFGGDLSAFSLFEVCQFLMIVRQTGTLTIRSNGKNATITFSEGQIVGVVDDQLSEGEEAFYRIVTWGDGMFEYGPGPVAIPSNSKLGLSTEGMLLEAARKLDEGEIGADGHRQEKDFGSHTRLFRQNQVLATEFADLLSSLDAHSDDSLDFQKDVPLEKILKVARKRRASRVYLRVGEEPKARVGERVVSIGRVAVTQRALDRISRKYFNGQQKQAEVKRSPLVGERHIEGHGKVLLECEQFPEGDRLGITLLSSNAPPLDDFGIEGDRVLQILRAPHGLLLVGSPPRGGKSALAASIALNTASRIQRHVVYFEESRRYCLRESGGLLESRELRATDGTVISDQAWRHKADVLVVDAIRHPGQLEGALDAARSGALVVAVVEAYEPTDAIIRFLSIADGERREEVAARLAESILGLLVVSPRDPGGVAEGESLADLAPTPYRGQLVSRVPGLPDAILKGDRNAIQKVLLDPGLSAAS